MARKKIRPKNRKQPTPEWAIKYLMTGEEPGMNEPGALDCFQLQGDTVHGGDRLQTIWGKERAGILKFFKQNMPGRRPWAWWIFAAPESRLKISGGGLPSHEKYPAVMPSFFMGVPKYFEEIDESDPPLYESEPSYLKRLGLLSKTEEKRLSEVDFKPVSVLDMMEKKAEK